MGIEDRMPRRLPRRAFLGLTAKKAVEIGAYTAATAVAGAGIGFVLSRTIEGNDNPQSLNFPDIGTGQVLTPISDSSLSRGESGFLEGELRVILTQEELERVLLRVRDQDSKPIKYPFDPAREVVAVVALGQDKRPQGFSVAIGTAAEDKGVMRVQSTITETFYGHTPEDQIPMEENSPFAMAKFPRLKKGNQEVRWEMATSEITLVQRKDPPLLK